MNWTDEGKAVYRNNCEYTTDDPILTIVKVIDLDGNPNTANDQTPGEGWAYDVENAQDNVELITQANGETEETAFTAGTFTITEDVQDGFVLVGARCTGATDNGSFVDDEAIEDIVLSNTENVTCTFYNSPAAQATVCDVATGPVW